MPVPVPTRSILRRAAAAMLCGALLLGAAVSVSAQTPPKKDDGFQTAAPYAILIDADSGTVLFEKNADKLNPPASMSKLMTVELVLHTIKEGKLKLDDEMTISENAWRRGGAPSGGSAMFAALHSKVSVDNLLHGVMIQSGNDDCITLAEGIAGTELAFADMMNKRAREIGLTQSHFANATGLHDPEHNMTVRELAKLAQHVIKTYPDAYKIFSESMLMGMAQRMMGPGQLTLRGMISLDPIMGARGYPLLLQTGETANGRTPLIDRQHPHDLFMELAGIYSVPVADRTSVFLYAGYPGEPALGPPTFMHRFSAMADPEAPIAHHWLDATHITYGVLTAGLVYGDWKIEGSVFNGREPDQHRWNFDPLRLNSESARLTFNPDENWSFQMSYGVIKSPEQLEPGIDQRRITASAIYNRKFEHGSWQTTFAWGRNNADPGPSLDAFLLESAVSWDAHTIFARAENVDKNELFQSPDPLTGRAFNVSKFSLGYMVDVPLGEHVSLGVGALGSVYALPSALDRAYGASPTSATLFTRLKLK